MSLQKRSKLNKLARDIPTGLVIPLPVLQGKGFSRQLLRKYTQNGWLESPARGVYRRPGPPLRWQTAVASVAQAVEPSPHIGGISAFEEQGRAHFVPLSEKRPLHLYADRPLPPWLHGLRGLRPFEYHPNSLFPPGLRAGIEKLRWGEWEWELPISSLERAYLELLDESSPDSLAHEKLLLEGLGTLRPSVLNTLLAECCSVKVKRLFFALAERAQHAWFPRLDRKNVDLGRGKRVFARGGKLDSKYLITLPADVDDRY